MRISNLRMWFGCDSSYQTLEQSFEVSSHRTHLKWFAKLSLKLKGLNTGLLLFFECVLSVFNTSAVLLSLTKRQTCVSIASDTSVLLRYCWIFCWRESKKGSLNLKRNVVLIAIEISWREIPNTAREFSKCKVSICWIPIFQTTYCERVIDGWGI